MTHKLVLALSISILTALPMIACSSADVADPIGKAESAVTSLQIRARTRYLSPDGACGDEKGTNVCTFDFGAPNPTEILTAVSHDRVELTYLVRPDFLFARGGLAVKEAIPLDEETTNTLGLPPGTMVQPQFAPLTGGEDGEPVTVSLNVGTVLVAAPKNETFEPATRAACCSNNGDIKICTNCTGGNSSETPPFHGSWCCINSIHFNPI
ncbi:Hypothetical protein A7982_04508 [Minicystis rosea]|nr:Hypothetical protein A7982_04508 [Minicystis rosea]